MEMLIENPQASPWWEASLIWMLDQDPALTYELWQTDRERLIEKLENAVKYAAEKEVELSELPEDQRQEIIQNLICPMTEFPEVELPQELRREIYDWAMSPERVEDQVEIEVQEEPTVRKVKTRQVENTEIPREGSWEELQKYLNGK